MNKIKNSLDQSLSHLHVSPELRQKILNQGVKSEQPVPIFYRRRRIVVVLAVVLSLLLSFTALAVAVPSVNDLVYALSPEAAEFLQPLNAVAEDKGIRMEVLAAMNDSRTAVIYVALTDLTGNRVDETTDLYNFFFEGPTSFGTEFVSFDAEQRQALFRLTGTGGEKLNGKKITFRLDSFLSGKKKYPTYDTGLSLRELAKHSPEKAPLSDYQYLGGGGSDKMERQDERMDILYPDQVALSIPGVDFVKISGIGFIDGRLHIQTKWAESVDNHGELTIQKTDGTLVASTSYYFLTSDDRQAGDRREHHIEFVYDLREDELAGCILQGNFVADGNYTTGKWQTSFRLSPVDSSSLTLSSTAAQECYLTPIGLYLIDATNGNHEAVISFTDGRKLNLSAGTTQITAGKRTLSMLADTPLSVELIQSVQIDGETVYIRES